jgi:hypothetical protein
MLMLTTLNGYSPIQGTQAKPTAPASPQAPATTAEGIQRINSREFREQIEQIRATAAAAAQQARAGADVSIDASPTPATPPTNPRVFTFRQRDGDVTTMTMPPADQIIPPQAVDISIAFFLMLAVIIIGLPLARAFARRMDRKSAGPAQIPREVSDQLVQINQAVDAIALEVERISEGQRYTTRLLSEQRDPARQSLPTGAQR